MFDNRQGDLYLFNTLDGGEIVVANGEPVMDQGLESAVYISLEGASTPWFANEFLLENQKIQSKFAQYRKGQTLTSGVINTSIDLIKQDLAWLKKVKAADEIIVLMSIIARNLVQIDISIRIGTQVLKLSPFQLNWVAQETFPANQRI
jgi:phage gp46-like protein